MCFKIRFQLKRHFFALFSHNIPFLVFVDIYTLYDDVLCCFSFIFRFLYRKYILCMQCVLSVLFLFHIQSTTIFWHITNNYIICGMYVHVSKYIYIYVCVLYVIYYCIYQNPKTENSIFSIHCVCCYAEPDIYIIQTYNRWGFSIVLKRFLYNVVAHWCISYLDKFLETSFIRRAFFFFFNPQK